MRVRPGGAEAGLKVGPAFEGGGVRWEALRISNAITYIDFSSNTRFMDAFTSALFLPHTNLSAFPSVKITA